ncbi:MAG: CRISPR-associated endoribonuclease Cas6 [Nitrosotalea sp.]
MRFSVTYNITGKDEIPLDYRSGFMALIKTALDKNIGYSKAVFQNDPFCFAVRFDKKPTIVSDKLLIGEKLTIYVTSTSSKLITNIYNGLLLINNFPLFETEISNPKFSYIDEYAINSDKIVFITLSPIVIRNSAQKDRYITPKDENFNESFYNTLNEQWRLYNTMPLDFQKNSFELVKYKKVVARHYNGLVLGFTGLLKMWASSDVLNFFYQSGIGYRRSNGFGFVKVDS